MIVWTFVVGGKHTRASHVCTSSVRLFAFTVQMTTRQNGFERDYFGRGISSRGVEKCRPLQLLRSSHSLLRRPPPRRIIKKAAFPLASRAARAALELEAIDSALTHSTSLLPSHLSLPPSITLFPSLLILRRSLGGLSFLASFPARGRGRVRGWPPRRRAPALSRLRKRKAVPPLPHLGAYYIIYNGSTPLHSTPLARTPSPSLSSTFSDLSLSLSPAAAKRFAAGRFKKSRSQL